MKDNISEPPVINFTHLPFEESRYVRGGKCWYATTLQKACKEQDLQPFEYPLAAYDLSQKYFDLNCTDDFIWQMQRTLDADYEKYPIILDDLGQVADGNHRIAHAILDGKTKVLAYRLHVMPEPDFTEKENE